MAKPKLLINPTTVKVNRDTIIKVTIIKVEFTIIKDEVIKDRDIDRDIKVDLINKDNEDICKEKLFNVTIITIDYRFAQSPLTTDYRFARS